MKSLCRPSRKSQAKENKTKQAKDLSRCTVKTGIIKWKRSTWRDTHCHYTPENDAQSNRYRKIPHTLPEQWKEKTVVMNCVASRTFTHPWVVVKELVGFLWKMVSIY